MRVSEAMKTFLEVLGSIVLVVIPTLLIYGQLAGVTYFWTAQFLWSAVLAVGWVLVSFGYYHQGWLIHKRGSSKGVSLVLPAAVFCVQCVLFVKGIYYGDWSLIWGAVVVNTGVLFNLYQILRHPR